MVRIVSLADKQTDKCGKIVLIYGETGVGKTVTALQTLPGKILVLTCENRDIMLSVAAAKRNPSDVYEAKYTNWEELLELLSDPTTSQGVDNIILDGLTQLITGNMQFELIDAAADRRSEKGKNSKAVDNIITDSKMSQELYGALSHQMKRMTNLLFLHAKNGMKNIVITALLEEHPKWNMVLSAAPALAGREFPKVIPGLCDYIGLLENRYESKTEANGLVSSKLIYPPMVKFEQGSTEQFQCKWSGPKINGWDKMCFPLDFGKMFGAIEKEVRENRGKSQEVASN